MLTGSKRREEVKDAMNDFLSMLDGIIRTVGTLGPTFLGNGYAEP
jgi:hypothetical protein